MQLSFKAGKNKENEENTHVKGIRGSCINFYQLIKRSETSEQNRIGHKNCTAGSDSHSDSVRKGGLDPSHVVEIVWSGGLISFFGKAAKMQVQTNEKQTPGDENQK